MARDKGRGIFWGLLVLVAAAVVLGELRTASHRPAASFRDAAVDAPGAIGRLFAERASGVMVEGEGTVERILPDDLSGSRHQRFIVRLSSGQTLLVSHNIDLAPRVEGLREGDALVFRGEYEWNDRGGLVHWTHHDPDGRRTGGWLRHRERTYR